MFSAVYNINRKFEALEKKEKLLSSYYDPQGSEKNKRHRHFVDIYQDYNEDMKNYGFSRYSWKKDEAIIKTTKETKKSLKPAIKTKNNSKRPSQNVIVPSVTPKNYQESLQKYKFWRYTKKFDVNLKSLIRNTSALSKIYLDGAQGGTEPVEIHEFCASNDEIEGKLDAFLKQTDNKNIYKQIPSEKEKDSVFKAFKEAQQSQIHKIKEQDIKYRTFDQFKVQEDQKEKTVKRIIQKEKETPINKRFINKEINKYPIDEDSINALTDIATMEFLKEKKTLLLNLDHHLQFSNQPFNPEDWLHGSKNEIHLSLIDIRSLKILSIKIDSQKRNFSRIFSRLIEFCSEEDQFRYPEPLVLILGSEGVYGKVFYERFRLFGVLTGSNEYRVCKSILSFYLCLLLLFDKKERKLDQIKENSTFLLEKGENFNTPIEFKSFFDRLKKNGIIIEDKRKTTKLNLSAYIDRLPLFSEETSVQKRFFSPENREFEQDYRFFHSPKEESLELLGKATIALPIKMNVKFLKKRPLTSGSFNRKGYKTIETPINYKIRNNFICTPMKGIYKGENEDYWEDEFRTISVFGEGAKIYK